jgi:hypothetical protein
MKIIKLNGGNILKNPIIEIIGKKGDEKYLWIGTDSEDMRCFGTIGLMDILKFLKENK